jgi:hypothetical protein
MHVLSKHWRFPSPVSLMLLSCVLSACGGARDENVAGVSVPVPRAMERVSGQGVELSIPGFGAGQAAFHGDMAPEKITEFYQKEMPTRGWHPVTSLLSRGGVLTFSKEGKNVLLAIGAHEGKSTLSVTVSNAGK